LSLDKYTVQLRKDGQDYTIPFKAFSDSIKQTLPHDITILSCDIRMLMERLNKIERILSKYILVPAMQQKILSYLKTHPNVPTRIFMKQVQPTSEYYGTLEKLAWFEAKAQLEADGQIISQIQGKGKNRTWTLKDYQGKL